MGRGSGGRHQRGIGPREQNRQNRGEHRYGSTRGHAIMGTDDKPKDHTSTSDTTVITRPRVGFGTPIVRLNVTTETSLSDVLQAARSDWRGTKLTTVLNKLGKAQIETVSDLLTALRGRGNLHLNQRLEAVGEECFTGATLRVMLYQAEMLDRPSKTDAMSEIKNTVTPWQTCLTLQRHRTCTHKRLLRFPDWIQNPSWRTFQSSSCSQKYPTQ